MTRPGATSAEVRRDKPSTFAMSSTFAIDDPGMRRRIAVMRASIEEVLGGQDKLS